MASAFRVYDESGVSGSKSEVKFKVSFCIFHIEFLILRS
jgi:hypothetical protein